MSVDLSAAREFRNYLRKFSDEELIPPFLNPDPSQSEIYQAQLSWFVYEVRTPGTPQFIEYGQTDETRLPLAVFAAVIGQKNNEPVGRPLRLLDHGPNGIVRLTENIPVLIPRLNAHEVRRLMKQRHWHETEASRDAHRLDAIHGTNCEQNTCASEATVEVDPALKRRLVEELHYILKIQKDALDRILTGVDSEKHLRVSAERFWEADVTFHELIMEVAGWLLAPSHVRNLRCKMRLVGGYKDVVLGRAEKSVEEHTEIATALSSMCDNRRNTEKRLLDLLSSHLEAAEKELLATLKKNYPAYYSDRADYDTPRLDLISRLRSEE